MQACTLTASNLACRRGDRILFRGVEAHLDAGSTLHVTGSNGIGKSSLIRILAGLLSPYEGAVKHVGTIGLMDERPALDPHVPLSAALSFWGGIDGLDELDENTHILGLEDLLDVPFRYLSTGQRKRAAFARLLGQRAQIWLLDEPLNGLDSDAKSTIESLIALHCQHGGICVIASHQAVNLPKSASLELEEFAL